MASEQTIQLVDSRSRRVSLAGAQMVFGRGTECDIRLNDELASRRHFAVVRTLAGWELTDLGSTNGTFLNGRRLRVGEMLPLALSDRITAGYTSFVVQLAQAPAISSPSAASGMPVPEKVFDGGQKFWDPRSAAANRPRPAWVWFVAVGSLCALALLGIGAFSPWLRVEVELTLQNLPGGDQLNQLLATAEAAIQSLTGKPPLVKVNTFEIQGMAAYGGLMLLVTGIAALVTILDLSMRWWRSWEPGFVIVMTAIIPGVILLIDARKLTRLADQEILFGVDLLTIVQGASEIIQPKLIPLSGLYLTAVGLVLLLIAGLIRTFMALISRYT